MNMFNLETFLTLAVWGSVAVVFWHYRSLALKQQHSHESPGRNPNARAHRNAGWQSFRDEPAAQMKAAVRGPVDRKL